MLPSVTLVTWLQNYTFGTKPATSKEKLGSALERHKAQFEARGMRRTVEVSAPRSKALCLPPMLDTAQAVLLVHDHKAPMVLLLRNGKDFRL